MILWLNKANVINKLFTIPDMYLRKKNNISYNMK